MWPCYLRYPAAGCPALLLTELQVTRASGDPRRSDRLLLEAAEEIVSSSLELLCVPNVLVVCCS
jgi:hypothetical protein